jgi:hypothetical protein
VCLLRTGKLISLCKAKILFVFVEIIMQIRLNIWI